MSQLLKPVRLQPRSAPREAITVKAQARQQQLQKAPAQPRRPSATEAGERGQGDEKGK